MAREVVTTSVPVVPTEPDGSPTLPAETPPPSRLRRAWAAPLWLHVVALGVVLVALVPVLGTGSSFSNDEGAAIIQARQLARGQGWIVEHPLPQVDPAGRAFPLESDQGTDGTAPFAKHPLYALLLAAADRVGGALAMVLLSIIGTLAAAALAAGIAGHLRPTLVRPSLWVAGLATPLLFDGYLVIAHTLGAAFAAGSVVLALRLIEHRGRPVVATVGIAGCVGVAVLFRTEAMFWGIALGVALGVVAVRRRSPPIFVAAVAAVAAVGVARVGEQAWVGQILGQLLPPLHAGPGTDLSLAGRLAAFELTWLTPGYGQSPGVAVALIVMLGSVVVGTAAARRMPEDRRLILGLAATASAAAVAALVIAPTNLVPGLLVASPVLAAGVMALHRPGLATVGSRVALGTFTIFALCVLATQYDQGGTVEWGGRYFALGLPVLVPVVLLALADAGHRLDRVTRLGATAALAICSLAMAVMGVTSLGDTHRRVDRLTTTAAGAGRRVAPTGRPVMLATRSLVPRLAWSTFDSQRWFLSPPDELAALVARLRAGGILDVVLVTRDLERDEAALGRDVAVVSDSGSAIGSRWRVVVLDLRP